MAGKGRLQKKKKRGFMDTDNGVVIVGEAVAQRWKKV